MHWGGDRNPLPVLFLELAYSLINITHESHHMREALIVLFHDNKDGFDAHEQEE